MALPPVQSARMGRKPATLNPVFRVSMLSLKGSRKAV